MRSIFLMPSDDLPSNEVRGRYIIILGGNELMKNYRYLNLEQKMAKIRKKMPSLLKKFHNDEGDYDFATLDDIYECMTPALNKYGVNFDIVGERPTQYDKKKKWVYLVQDSDGFWRYESDLDICWTNIDHPEEERRATIHIIGTHEIPDKARGTALTYGLKYYFRNKFCMRQIDSIQDDPDGMEYHTEETDAGAKAPASSKAGKEGSPRPGKTNPEKPVKNKGKETAGDSGNRISGNLCPKPVEDGNAVKAGKNVPKNQRAGMPVEEDPGNGGGTKETGRSHTEPKKQGEKEAQEPVKLQNHPEGTVKIGLSNEQGTTDQESKKAQAADRKESAVPKAVGPKEQSVQQKAESKNAVVLQTDGQKKEEQQLAKAPDQVKDPGDGFQNAKAEEVPFEDASFMEELEKGLEEEAKDGNPTLEAAKNCICPFGIYAGKPLGDVLNSGIKGREIVKWIAYRYQGPESEMVNAARILLENPDEVTEQQAA